MHYPVDVTVVINTRGRSELLRRTLESLSTCDRPTGFKGVIVVENGSVAGAEEIVRTAPAELNVSYRFSPVGGQAAARNFAVQEVRSGLIVWLDDDVRLTRSVLTAYAAAAAEHSDAFFGGPIGVDYEQPPEEWLKAWLPPSARGWRHENSDTLVKEPLFIGLNWAAFVHHIDQVGGFDVRFGPGGVTGSIGHETEIQERMLAARLRGCYVPDALVYHHVPQNRCDTSWALNRARRTGIWAGLRSANGGVAVFDVPVWVLREYLRRLVRLWMTPRSATRALRFERQRDVEVMAGWIKGVRHSRLQMKAAPQTGHSTTAEQI